MNCPILNIAVALIFDEAGRILLVRKRGTAAFMQPGGKIDPGEGAAAALVRELAEELALAVKIDDLRYLGKAEAPAANEPGMAVSAEIFAVRHNAPIAPQAEIAEAIWVDPARPNDLLLAPLTQQHILPLALAA